MELKVKILEEGKLPTKAYNSNGIDFYAAEDYILKPLEVATIRLGVSLEFDSNYILFLKDRSGIASKHGIHVFAGVIDHDYRGELKLVLFNASSWNFVIHKGDKICQGIFLKVGKVEDIENVLFLSETERGSKGFGSSGGRDV